MGGKVIDARLDNPTTRIIAQFNKMITAEQRVENIILPVRDSIMVINK